MLFASEYMFSWTTNTMEWFRIAAIVLGKGSQSKMAANLG